MEGDDFEWDERKAALNLRRHRISFQAARGVFNDAFALVEQDVSEEYGEDRFLATGMVKGLLITVVYTERAERIRIISARRANNNEQRKYYQGQTSS
jgi:uncharacterized DUF497 family protein